MAKIGIMYSFKSNYLRLIAYEGAVSFHASRDSDSPALLTRESTIGQGDWGECLSWSPCPETLFSPFLLATCVLPACPNYIFPNIEN